MFAQIYTRKGNLIQTTNYKGEENMAKDIQKLLGDEAKDLLTHKCTTIPKEQLHLPGPDFVERIFTTSEFTLKRS